MPRTAPTTPAATPAAQPVARRLAFLTAAGAFALTWLVTLRALAPQPWSYDEYYHLAVARLMTGHFRMHAFPWTPFSWLATHYADKELLFHVLLMPLARLPLEGAGLVGTFLGQLAMVAAAGWALWRVRAPHAPWLVLALPALGPMFVLRAEMLRPHLWLVTLSLVAIALLVEQASAAALAAVAAVAGLLHTGGWIVVVYAALAAAITVTVGDRRSGRAAEDVAPRSPWVPVLATAAGWLAGQLVHPQLPENLRLAWLQGVVIPLQATSGDAALQSQLGTELSPPGLAVLLDQWPALAAAALLVAALAASRRARSRDALVAAVPALLFVVVGSFFLRRFFELGAPLVLLALGVAWRDGRERAARPPRPSRFAVATAGLAILFALAWTTARVRDLGFGVASPPRAMAEWLAAHGRAGERVFTAQWADSAPLLWAAPALQSLVALDPTFFWVADRARFEEYVRIVSGAHGDPVAAVRRDFGARWVTVWKMPVYEAFARQLAASVPIVHDDPAYLVFDLAATAPSARASSSAR